ncbi:putative sugar transferase EpsL [Pullulanibacillus camelliae]|uniref:Putative sugar transferase EpsL n=1 Tax=Pullulanibacillus camelliae TaxID=1707096 RepID=A0A8J2VL99_9BACL|nr:sugar transferase [Pullulanibacillus camelliae]GGE30496.1 putative sugar transferase EpsL [Pullulanibacillus camelliae]
MKRGFDVIISSLLVLCLSPLILLLALVIKLKLGSPVIFKQQRPGLYGKPFILYKFRTMAEKYDETGNPLPDAVRLTNVGRWLRKYSLDELPQLFNVMRGELSLVGPRPLLMDYLTLYTEEQYKRHWKKPGMTGWAQINGRNGMSWEERFHHDVWYVEHWSFWLDLKILLLTTYKVIKPEGITAPGSETMEAFKGSDHVTVSEGHR